MLTLFSTPKPFVGHFGMIQRNALKSWTLLHPDIQVILFGDEPGAREACREIGIHHEPHLERSPGGASRADYMFKRAQEISKHDVLCYSNCDIVLMNDFVTALKRVTVSKSPFLMVGRRWDTDVREPVDFSLPDWQARLMKEAMRHGSQASVDYIDYFAFSRGAYPDMPPLVVGRIWWDHWMLWSGLQRLAVVDASQSVCAVHQNHDYSHHPQGKRGVYEDEDATRNFHLAGGRGHMRTIEDAKFLLTATEIQPSHFAWLAPSKRRWRKLVLPARRAFWTHCYPAYEKVMVPIRRTVWHPVLNLTRPIRHAIGLRKRSSTAS